jgi:uncharacterized membrane protein YeiH
MRGMILDRHIYATTAVLAAVLAIAISVLMPRDPFAGTIVHRETASAGQTAQASTPSTVEVVGRAVLQRLGASL